MSEDVLRRIHREHERERYEERHGMTDVLRRKIKRASRARGGRAVEITPAEHQALVDVYGGEDEDGRGWFSFDGKQIAYGPERMRML